MEVVTILSGKGGVGKSSITASLAVLLHQFKEKQIVVADCDVDASNLALIFGITESKNREVIATNEKAFVNEKAKNCKKLKDVCIFSAIDWNDGVPKINKYLCEGCGACKIVCPEGINLRKVKNAEIGMAMTEYGFPIVSGQLMMGETGSGKVVDKVKEVANKEDKELMLIDSAAGIGCPVIASIQNSDYVVAVTEPTPSALSDLKRALEVVEHFKIPYGLVINKFDLNRSFSKKIEEFARQNKIEILGKLPYSKKFVEALVNLKPVIIYDKTLEDEFKGILNRVIKNLSKIG